MIDINLLPKRKKEVTSPVFIISVLLLILLAVSIPMYVIWRDAQAETQELQKKVLVMKLETAKPAEAAEISSVLPQAQLERMVQDMQNDRIMTVPILKQLISFLPERGVFETFSYTDTGTIILEVRFDEKRDAAYFYSRLLGEKWVEQATLSFLKALEIRDKQGNVLGMPRYIAHYEMKLDITQAKEIGKEGTE